MDLPRNYHSVDAPVEPQPILPKPIPIFLVQTPLKSSIVLPLQYSDLSCSGGENETNKQENIHPALRKTQEQKRKIQKLKNREASQKARIKKKHIFREIKETIEKLRSENCLLITENSDHNSLKDTCYTLKLTNKNLQDQNTTLILKNLKLEARLSANLRETELESDLPTFLQVIPPILSPILVDIASPSPPAMTSPSPPAMTSPSPPAMTSPFPPAMTSPSPPSMTSPSPPAMLVGDNFQISAEEAMHLASAIFEMMGQLGCLPHESWDEPLLPVQPGHF